MKHYKVGYTSGVYDMFHVGHLNLLEKAKAQCDYLIVAVTTDELTSYKSKTAMIPFEDRCRIVEAIRCVDRVVPQVDMNKLEAWEKYQFDAMFVGDDWKGTDKWNQLEQDFAARGVDIVYFPYTKKVSSTILRERIGDGKREESKKNS